MGKPLIISFVFVVLLSSCIDYTPKPRGFFRLEPPEATYIKLPIEEVPYVFNISDKAVLELPEEQKSGWINLSYEGHNAKIYCSYLLITPATYPVVLKETYELAERITGQIKLSAYENPERKVFGELIELGGHVASPLQFYLTDSTSHFFRGALYYNCTPDLDSVAPMTEYFRNDIVELIETFSWKN